MIRIVYRYFLLIIIGLGTSCYGQPIRVEKQLYDCFEKSLLPGELLEVQQILNEFETNLIENGILESNQPGSYLKIYQNILENPAIKFEFEYPFSEKISRFNKKNSEALVQCHLDIFETDLYRQSKPYKMNTCMQSIKASREVESTMKRVGCLLSFLKESDFELPYYRQNTLILIETMKKMAIDDK